MTSERLKRLLCCGGPAESRAVLTVQLGSVVMSKRTHTLRPPPSFIYNILRGDATFRTRCATEENEQEQKNGANINSMKRTTEQEVGEIFSCS